ncbi:MAG: CPBP family intramembrane metalloprotease [Oscillospiraceae bacterium]|nr:CPBP family intramembrane metalloprotease [Oscillospiraceae bacterium]
MRKFYEKSEIWFAVTWIIIYVVGVSVADSISESIGMPSLITLIFSVAMATVLIVFMKKNGFMEQYGLCKFSGSYKAFLFFVPLAAICSINFWNGIAFEPSVGQCVIIGAAKGIGGIMEELIFRGLLFVAMCRTNVKSAIIVSSVTFGVGHIVNLLNGAPVFDTVCQIIYAVAIGFCFTVVFKTGKSLIPCIIAHFVVNASSALNVAFADMQMYIIVTIFLTVVSAGYAIYLAVRYKDKLLEAI